MLKLPASFQKYDTQRYTICTHVENLHSSSFYELELLVTCRVETCPSKSQDYAVLVCWYPVINITTEQYIIISPNTSS